MRQLRVGLKHLPILPPRMQVVQPRIPHRPVPMHLQAPSLRPGHRHHVRQRRLERGFFPTWQLYASVGLASSGLRQEGIGLVAVEQRIECKRELLAGDTISIRSTFQEAREKVLLFSHEMTNQETQELAARTFLTGVCIDINTRKARPLPSDIRERIT